MSDYEGQLLSDDIIEALKLDGRWIEEAEDEVA